VPPKTDKTLALQTDRFTFWEHLNALKPLENQTSG